MQKNRNNEKADVEDLLRKILVFQLYALGLPQDRIAKTVGRQKAWVNDLVKVVTKGGKQNGDHESAQKTKKRSYSR